MAGVFHEVDPILSAAAICVFAGRYLANLQQLRRHARPAQPIGPPAASAPPSAETPNRSEIYLPHRSGWVLPDG
jgi:hypothetical protein